MKKQKGQVEEEAAAAAVVVPSSPVKVEKEVELRACVEELIKFTLESHINKTLGFDIPLSVDFCTNLLHQQKRQYHAATNGEDDMKVSPEVPLYKVLAMMLCESSLSSRGRDTLSEAVVDIDSEPKKHWLPTLLQYRTQLQNILKSVNFEIHVQEPYFTQLKDGVKTVEGRCALGDYNRIGSGAMILVNKCVVLKVQDVRHYTSFFEMLEAETLAKVLPGIQTLEEGVQVYRKFYTEEKEKSNGVLAVCVDNLTDQPYISIASLLSRLGCRGVQSILDASAQNAEC